MAGETKTWHRHSGAFKRPRYCCDCGDQFQATGGRQIRCVLCGKLARKARARCDTRRRNGLNLQEIARLLEEQNRICPICQESVTMADAVDHCHKTGRTRGVLHGICNRGLGHFKDDPRRLRNAAAYLERFS